ncbi:metallophosphoesterase family protein [Pseudomonas sp. EpS/L25]|uniref:metallophosphoesterase family protein n=1 Tax=Pseudomonas sp. EpS/L25 TaxID=1749078 RepID=UPI000AF5DCEF|nr:metallophosphoesterase [Pseudomonas sp. EpS/L25]
MKNNDLKKLSWLHLSDFHIGKAEHSQSSIVEKILKIVELKIKKDGEPDFVFITGDIANKGLKSEYERFWEIFIEPLEVLIPSLLSEKLFLIPGNHDLNRDKNDAFDRTLLLQPTGPYFAPEEKSLSRRDIVVARFEEFIAHDVTGYSDLFQKSDGAYSVVLEKNGCSVGIVGINTAWLCKDDHDYKRLTPGKSLLEQALLKTKGTDLTIVLGHHPIDWLSSDHARPIASILGQNHTLYLHGHMHDAWVSPDYGSGNHFLSIQCGAAFQAHEADKWKNGFIWAEADLNNQTLDLKSYEWINKHQEWIVSESAFPPSNKRGDTWRYLLPRKMNAFFKEAIESGGNHLPGGWDISTANTLNINRAELALDEAISFFNGATPTWRTALSISIPQRRIVQKSAAIFKDLDTSDKPIVGLIISAGCEGKSTALLQTAYEVALQNPDIQILRRHNDFRPFNHTTILEIINNDKKWLIVLDEADQEAESILEFINKHIEILGGRIHFLLACRDSAWIASSAVNLRWSSAKFKQERLSGLTQSDAEAIVQAWAAYGNDGLGALSNTPPQRRAAIFKEYADREIKKTAGSGALFGALLLVRHGDDLYDHAKTLVDKLETVEIGNGLTLKDAIAYIAIMHAEDQNYLCKDVLQKTLEFEGGNFHSAVIRPLGQEAAATATSTYIYTRHKYIAKEIIKVLTDDYSLDIQSYYIKLVQSALALMTQGKYLKDLQSWRYKLADHFIANDNSHLAITIAEAIRDHDPHDTYTTTYLARLYRESSRAKNAIELFRSTTDAPKTNRRAFFFEWSVSEGFSENLFESATLCLFSLSDDCEYLPLPVDLSIMLLNGASESFKRLHARYPDNEFMQAFHATCFLLLLCETHDKKSEISQNAVAYGKGIARGLYSEPSISAAIESLKAAFSLCKLYIQTDEIANAIEDVASIEFSRLDRMAKNIGPKQEQSRK